MRKLRWVATLALLAASLAAVAVSGGLLALRQSHAETRYEDLALLANVLHHVQEYYVTEVDERQLIEGALKGMLDTLDPHTSFLSADLYKDMQRDTKGEFEGLGIEITKKDGYVTVVAPIDGTPAATAGLQARDQIVAVCPDATELSCQSTQEMNLLEAVKLMRGQRGTKIMIQVLRDGWSAPRPFVIKRDAIKVSSVKLQMIEPNLPYVRVSQFQERTAQDLREVLDQAHRDTDEIKGLVLDLRDNPGGLLEQAVAVADTFLKTGPIVYSEGRGGSNRMEWHAKEEGTEPDYPMVVLVNGGSASASEIVAGALQDHSRALVLGQETFGKGSVQTIIPLDDGSGLRLTTALYYLPSGRSIQEVRIKPDVPVEPFSEAQVKAIDEAQAQHSFGEEDLEGHIQQKAKAKPAEAAKVSAEDPAERVREGMRRDAQLTRAVDLLKSWTIFSNLNLRGQQAKGS
jgi:carboxyl-terminal processing protease